MAATEQWLKNAKAAEILGVGERTIKSWMTNPAMRHALGAVRHGRQWRIPLPDDEDIWEWQTDSRLKAAGVTKKTSWERGWEKFCKKSAHCELESYRLWLAAYLQVAVKSGGVTQEDITAILLLWQTACKILGSQPKRAEVDKLKSKFPDQLRARNFPEDRICFIMSYWPEQKHFKRVRAAHTLEQLEKIRSGMDTAQAVKTCKNLGQKPTAENLRPLHHKNIMEHINDTRDNLPPSTIKAHTPEELRRAVEADYWCKREQVQSETWKAFIAGNFDVKISVPAGPVIDLRQPQNGLALRTFRKRHPLKNSPLKKVIAAVYDVQDGIPSVDEKPDTGKTPVRGG